MAYATYTVANILDAFGFEHLVIVHATDGNTAKIFYVNKDGDHSGLYSIVSASAMYDIRTAELLA